MSLPKINIQLVNQILLSDLQNGQGGYCYIDAKRTIEVNPSMEGQLHAFIESTVDFCLPVWREGGVLKFGKLGETFP